MAIYNVYKNSSLQVVLEESYQDNGWTISQGVAIHDSLNSGFLSNLVFKTEPDTDYTIVINVMQASQGVLDIYLGNNLVKKITEVGTYRFKGSSIDSSGLKMWSDGNFAVKDILILKGETEYRTLLFSNDNNIFTGEMSYSADLITKFLDDMYSFKDGTLWKHNSNELRNNFYGVQYPSKLTFHVNSVPELEKDFYSIILNSNMTWFVEDIYIYPKEGKRRGQRSKIKPGNFKMYKGRYVADFLRDINDPRFSDEITALMKGASLQGCVMRITISNNSSEEVVLSSVETEFSVK